MDEAISLALVLLSGIALGLALWMEKLGLTHEDMAQMIGTSREAVSRTLADFKKRRLIEQIGATLVVHDRMALQSMVAG
ncbi:MAG: helix-turn-helix domain-containing protein [Terriglobales bacterium]